MAIIYKMDITAALLEAGYSSYTIRKNKLLSEATMSRLRNNEMISMDSLDRICKLLQVQPGDVIKFVDDNE